MLFALPFLLVVGLALPALGWLGWRRAKAGGVASLQDVPISAIAIQILVVQTIVGGLAWLAMLGAAGEISWALEITPFTFGIGWLTLGALIVVALVEARRPLGPEARARRRLRKIAATNPVWIATTLYASVIEEFAYRGVLVLLLQPTLGYWPGAAVSALLFGLAHLSNGKRALLIGVPFALAMQLLVYFSGGLTLAIIVHLVYDLAAAWIGRRLAPASAESVDPTQS